MTVLAGYAPSHHLSGVLELASSIATALDEDLVVLTVMAPRWNVPSMARVDAEFAQWAQEQAEHTLGEARSVLTEIAPRTPVTYRKATHRSAASALQATAEEVGASVIVVGSCEDGRRGHVELGSTSDPLLHSSRIPVAIAPRGYEGPGQGLSTLTCAVADHDSAKDLALITAAQTIARRAGVPLRLVTFAVRLGTMYGSNLGLRAEDDLVQAAREHAYGCFARWRESGTIPPDVETVVGLGQGWRAAIDSITWDPAGLLLLGSTPRGSLAQVFLGSSATKIVRHSPVPVLVLPDSADFHEN